MGSALALALHQAGRQVRLLDAAQEPVSGDDRSLGLTTGSVRFLQSLGIQPAGAQPIRSLHISERGRFGRSLITAAEHDLESLGLVVPAQALHDALDVGLQKAGLEVDRGCRLEAMPLLDDGMEGAGADASSPACAAPAVEATPLRRVRWSRADGSQQVLDAQLVIGADGAQSAVRQALGIAAHSEDYGQLALVSQLECSKDPQGCAYERFAGESLLAVLPRGPQRVGVIWMLPTAAAQSWVEAGPEAFAQGFQQAFGWRLGRLRPAAPILRWPLKRVRAHRLTGPRALLMGNAAANFHPVAAQGFNLALRDAAALCAAVHEQTDPGQSSLLAELEASRQADHQATERMTDGLTKLFGQALPALAQLRSLGLLGLDLLPGLQGGLVRRSAGLREVF